MLRITLFYFLVLTLVSCGSEKNAVPDNSNSRDFICGGNFNSPEKVKIHRGASIFQMGSVIKNADTLYPSELICLDSVEFTRALFEDAQVSEICLEIGAQGNTYFSARTNKYGGFEDVKVVRSVESCFRDFEKRIISKVSKMRVIQEEYFSSEIIFRHKYIIR
jgi:hypothetical protein